MQKKKKADKKKAAKPPKKKKAPRKSSLSVDTKKATNMVSPKTKNNSNSKGSKTKNARKPLDMLTLSRVGLAVVLIVSAAAFAYGSYVWIDWSESQTLQAMEQELARTQFEAVAERAHTEARAALERSKLAAESLAAVAGSTFPTPAVWPLVRIPGFEAVTDPLRKIAIGSLGFAPVVLGSDKQRFEDYWYDYYYNIGYLNSEGDTFINKLGDTTSNFGNGIFGIGGYDVLNDKVWGDTRYPILVNGTKHGYSNPDNIMVPMVQSEDGLDSNLLMLDTEANYQGFLATRAALECAQDLRENPDDDWAAQNSLGCGSLSDLVWDEGNPRDVSVGPSGTLFLPIYPGNDVSREVAGFIVHSHLWRNLFRTTFGNDVSGIRIVLKTDSPYRNGHTFEVLGGRVVYVGNQTHTCSGNFTDKECLPDSEWEPFEDLYYLHEDPSGDFRSINLGITDGIVSQDTSSVRYFVDVYATPEFVDQFCATDANIHQVTNDLLPIPLSVAVCLGVVNIVLFTSLMFVLYDYFVRKSQGLQGTKGKKPMAAGGLLAAKRKFVRFVSHEIRTPLNTVCMGLTLLENDLAAALGESDDATKDDDKRIYPSKGRGSSGKGGTLEKALSVIKSPPEPPGENPSPRSNYKDPYSVPLFQQNFLPSFTDSKRSDESVHRRVVGEDELVLKKKSVEDWLSLSGQVVRNADNAVGVLSDLLIYDKVQTGNLSLEVSLMDLWGTLENVVEGFSAAAAEKSVSLSIDLSPLVESPASPKEPPKVEKSTKAEKDSKPSSIRFWKKSTESGKDDKDKDEKPSSLKALWKKTTESPKDKKPSSTKGHWKVYENPVASGGKGREKRESLTLDKAFSGPTNLKASDLPERIQNCKIIGDKIRLTQVFRNLISYGLKFSKKRSNIIVRVSMRIFPERSQKLKSVKLSGNASAKAMNVGTVTVEIIQEGIGMKQTEIDTVFEDSTQFVENIEQSLGSNQDQVEAGSNEGIDLNDNKIGLGMNIARCIVVQHGGSLTCSSRGARKGTTFALTVNLYTENNSIVPLACAKTVSEMSSRSVMSDDDMPDDVERGMGSRDSLPSFHVLVVDDSLTNRKLCQRLLERSGHTTEGASNGKEAVEMVKESLKNGKFYDTILLDYEMPVMNGPDACRLIRQLGCLSYIAGVTGNVMSEDVDRFRRCGANWVLSKPFSIKAIEDQWIEDNVKHVVQTGGDVMGSGEEQEVILEEK